MFRSENFALNILSNNNKLQTCCTKGTEKTAPSCACCVSCGSFPPRWGFKRPANLKVRREAGSSVWHLPWQFPGLIWQRRLDNSRRIPGVAIHRQSVATGPLQLPTACLARCVCLSQSPALCSTKRQSSRCAIFGNPTKAMPKFGIGNRVRIRTEGQTTYAGLEGVVQQARPNERGIAALDQYDVLFEWGEKKTFYEAQLEPITG